VCKTDRHEALHNSTVTEWLCIKPCIIGPGLRTTADGRGSELPFHASRSRDRVDAELHGWCKTHIHPLLAPLSALESLRRSAQTLTTTTPLMRQQTHSHARTWLVMRAIFTSSAASEASTIFQNATCCHGRQTDSRSHCAPLSCCTTLDFTSEDCIVRGNI
jgi:hypothetical protein